MIGQLYGTAEKGTGSLPERVHFQWQGSPLAHIAAMAEIVPDTTISIAAGGTFGWFVTGHRQRCHGRSLSPAEPAREMPTNSLS